jgi:hypothetical protein
VYGVTKFRQYLYGRRFTLVTDHKPLVSIFSPEKKIPVLTAQRLQRWALTLMGYQYDIRFKPTKEHGNADGLSRLPTGPDKTFDEQEANDNTEISHAVQEDINSSMMNATLIRKETQEDIFLQQISKWISEGSWPMKLASSDENLRPYWNM